MVKEHALAVSPLGMDMAPLAPAGDSSTTPFPILAAFFREDQVHDALLMMEGVISFIARPLDAVTLLD